MNKTIKFAILGILLVLLLFVSINLGSIRVTFSELLNGLFVRYNENVATIYDLRFPRIIIAMLTGAALAVSGVLFQTVMKNPLADPGIIGISAGASFTAIFITMLFPSLFFFSPLLAFFGGIVACILVYTLSWKSNLSPLHLILVGIAVNAVFTGLLESINYMTGGKQSGAMALVNANISMKTWNDVHTMFWYVLVGLIAAVFCSGVCDLLSLEDKTVRNLGVNITVIRLVISCIAVLLASISTAVAGSIGFVGLVVPHIARLLVGSNHKVLIPYSMLCGSFTVLFADTVGRAIARPYEIPTSVIMAVIGGPFLIILLRRSGKANGN